LRHWRIREDQQVQAAKDGAPQKSATLENSETPVCARALPSVPELAKHGEEIQANSRGEMAAPIGGFAVGIVSRCPWTVRLLKRLGRFHSAVEGLCRVSPFAENVGEQFLFKMSASQDPLVAAMARLELALMRMIEGSTDEYLVEWDRDPEALFVALRSGGELPPAEPGPRYRTYISRDVPELVRCEREEKACR